MWLKPSVGRRYPAASSGPSAQTCPGFRVANRNENTVRYDEQSPDCVLTYVAGLQIQVAYLQDQSCHIIVSLLIGSLPLDCLFAAWRSPFSPPLLRKERLQCGERSVGATRGFVLSDPELPRIYFLRASTEVSPLPPK